MGVEFLDCIMIRDGRDSEYESILLTNGRLCEKIEAHRERLQHWAFSLFLFNNKRELLLQRRSMKKYHSGGLWSNTCCGHFCSKEELENKEAKVLQRLKEELRVACTRDVLLRQVAIYTYDKYVGGGLFENEIDYIFTCYLDVNIKELVDRVNRDEVDDVKFVDIKSIREDLDRKRILYSVWFGDIVNNDSIMNKILLA